MEDYIVMNGITYELDLDDPENERIMYGLVNQFVHDKGDKTYAKIRL